jgi:hypothetical protein
VELVRGVGQPLPVAPADRVALCGRERLGHERVVVDRHDVVAQRRSSGGNAFVAEPPVARERFPPQWTVQRRPVGPQAGDRRALEDAHAKVEADPAQPPGEPGRVDQRGAVARPQTAQVGRASSPPPAPHRRRAAPPSPRARRPGRPPRPARRAATAEWPRRVRRCAPRRSRWRTRGWFPRCRPDSPAEPFQRGDLTGEALGPVRSSVGQARRAEPAVAAGRRDRRRHRSPAAPRRARGWPAWLAGPSTARSSRHRPPRGPRRSDRPAPAGGGPVRPIQPVRRRRGLREAGQRRRPGTCGGIVSSRHACGVRAAGRPPPRRTRSGTSPIRPR